MKVGVSLPIHLLYCGIRYGSKEETNTLFLGKLLRTFGSQIFISSSKTHLIQRAYLLA